MGCDIIEGAHYGEVELRQCERTVRNENTKQTPRYIESEISVKIYTWMYPKFSRISTHGWILGYPDSFSCLPQLGICSESGMILYSIIKYPKLTDIETIGF